MKVQGKNYRAVWMVGRDVVVINQPLVPHRLWAIAPEKPPRNCPRYQNDDHPRRGHHRCHRRLRHGAGVFGRSEPQPRLLLVTAHGSFWPPEILDCRAVNPALGVRRISKNAPESTRTKPVALIWKPPRLSEARIIIKDFRRE